MTRYPNPVLDIRTMHWTFILPNTKIAWYRLFDLNERPETLKFVEELIKNAEEVIQGKASCVPPETCKKIM